MFAASLLRGIRQLGTRKIYFFMMIVVPAVCSFFFLNLMHEGLPLKVPVAIVDNDQSSMSRDVTRQLNAMELIDINEHLESYHEAMEKMRSGEIFGFFHIPEDFQKDAVGSRHPTLSFYCNMTVFVPGTLSFK